RTEGGAVAASINDHAQAGDLVVYCPDQLAPATHRLLRRHGLVERKYPLVSPGDPRVGLIDWVDYQSRIDDVLDDDAAAGAQKLAGAHGVFVVTFNGYRTHLGRCPRFLRLLGVDRHEAPSQLVAPDLKVYEPASLYYFAPKGAST